MKIHKLTIFWRCFITFAICTALSLIVLLYSYKRISEQWQLSYTEQVSNTFISNSKSFSDIILRSCYIPVAMKSNDLFRTLITSESFDTPSQAYYLSRSMASVSDMKELFPLADDVLIYMHKSGAVLTSSRIYGSLEDCFSSSYQFGRVDIFSLLKNITPASFNVSLIAADEISIKHQAATQYLTCVRYDWETSCTYLFLIPISKIRQHFRSTLSR